MDSFFHPGVDMPDDYSLILGGFVNKSIRQMSPVHFRKWKHEQSGIFTLINQPAFSFPKVCTFIDFILAASGESFTLLKNIL